MNIIKDHYSDCICHNKCLSVSLTSAPRPVDRYSALNQSAAQKAEHVDVLRCAAGQSLTFQRQQQRQQQAERPQGAGSHDSGLHTREQPVQSESKAGEITGPSPFRLSAACGSAPSHGKAAYSTQGVHYGSRRHAHSGPLPDTPFKIKSPQNAINTIKQGSSTFSRPRTPN